MSDSVKQEGESGRLCMEWSLISSGSIRRICTSPSSKHEVNTKSARRATTSLERGSILQPPSTARRARRETQRSPNVATAWHHGQYTQPTDSPTRLASTYARELGADQLRLAVLPHCMPICPHALTPVLTNHTAHRRPMAHQLLPARQNVHLLPLQPSRKVGVVSHGSAWHADRAVLHVDHIAPTRPD